jgi:hypothetical protein
MQQDATLRSLYYLETALHVSGGTTTNHQERIQLCLQHLVFVTPLLIPATIADFYRFPKLKLFLAGQRFPSNQEAIAAVEEYFADLTKNHYRDGIMALEYHWNKVLVLREIMLKNKNNFEIINSLLLPAAIAAGSSNDVTNTRCCRYSCMRS